MFAFPHLHMNTNLTGMMLLARSAAGDIVIAISNSGETSELVHLLDVLNQRNIESWSIVGKTKSSMESLASGGTVGVLYCAPSGRARWA